jgi:hypothetical protein
MFQFVSQICKNTIIAYYIVYVQKYPTFQNQFFAQPYISEIVWGIQKKVKKFYEQYLMNQHGPEPALVKK